MTAEAIIGSKEWTEEVYRERSLTMEDGRERGQVPENLEIKIVEASRQKKVEPKRESLLELL